MSACTYYASLQSPPYSCAPRHMNKPWESSQAAGLELRRVRGGWVQLQKEVSSQGFPGFKGGRDGSWFPGWFLDVSLGARVAEPHSTLTGCQSPRTYSKEHTQAAICIVVMRVRPKSPAFAFPPRCSIGPRILDCKSVPARPSCGCPNLIDPVLQGSRNLAAFAWHEQQARVLQNPDSKRQ